MKAYVTTRVANGIHEEEIKCEEIRMLDDCVSIDKRKTFKPQEIRIEGANNIKMVHQDTYAYCGRNVEIHLVDGCRYQVYVSGMCFVNPNFTIK